MPAFEKIRQIRKEKGMSLRKLHQRLEEIFGKEALRYNTLYRIEKGLRKARVSSLSQICLGLGISLKEIEETISDDYTLAYVIRKNDTLAQYIYSEEARAQILTKETQNFLALRLILEPQAKTKLEQDPIELGKFEKWVYVLKGNLCCNIGKETYNIRKDDTLIFESTLPHYFENKTNQKAVCIIVQNPKHI
jgi:transcriptional regulator with XRE-family HTH domain